ncbi:MAG: TetR/AcrR family transcriptional regulator [Acidimicrobiales bacterium]|nr:TetR/AcrR family transcriptional regulator [Acidimicrobiales bacterium]
MRARNQPASTERLLQATFACVARYGIGKTTVEDVAREAGVSRATVYRQFPGGKDQLVSDTIRWESTRFFAELAAAIEHAPDFVTTVEEAVFFARNALDQHAVFQKVLETEPDTLLPHLTVDDSRLRGLVAAFLRTHLEPEAHNLAPGVSVEGAADHVARLLMSFMGASGSWNLADRAEVRRLVRSELLAGVFVRS